MKFDKRILREALARKYPTIEEARQFVSDVKLDPSRVEFNGRADLTWFFILEEAGKQGERSIRAVLELALEQHPGDEVLRRLLDGDDVRYAEGPDIASLPW